MFSECSVDAPTLNRTDDRMVIRDRSAGGGLLLLSADRSSRTRIPNTQATDDWPQWSPDGQWLSFVRQGNVFRIRADGAQLTPVTTLAASELLNGPAVWLPTGDRLVFAANVGGTNGLYVIGVGGEGLRRIVTGNGAAVQFAGSVATEPLVPAPHIQLTTIDPASGVSDFSLWPEALEFRFDGEVKPSSVNPALVSVVNSTGVASAFTLEPTNNRVRVRLTGPLLPGTTYTNRFLPGVTGANGLPATLSGNIPWPSAGIELRLSTATLGIVSPMNGTRVVAGQSFPVILQFSPGLGANWFGFRVNNGPRMRVANSPGANRVAVTLPLPPNATTARVQIEASPDESFSRALALTPIDLSVLSAGEGISLSAPPALALPAAGATNILITAQSAGSPLQSLGFAPGFVPPTFVAAGAILYTNTTTNGVGGFRIYADTAFAAPGDYVLPLEASSAAGTITPSSLTLSVIANPNRAVTHWKDPVNGDWSDASKWTAGLPGPGVAAVIDAPGDYTVALSQNVDTDHLMLGAASGHPQLDIATRRLSIRRAMFVTTNAVVRHNGTVAGNGLIHSAGLWDYLNGALEPGGPFTLAPGGVMRLSGVSSKGFHRDFVVYGNIDWVSGGWTHTGFGNIGSLRIESSGVFEMRSDDTAFGGRWVNLGSIKKTGAPRDPATVQTTFNLVFENHGELRLETGGLRLLQVAQHRGKFVLNSGTELRLEGTGQRFEASSEISGPGDFTVQNGIAAVAGSYTVTGRTSVRDTAAFENSEGVTVRNLFLTGRLDGAADVTVDGRFEWTSGDLRPGGVLRLAPGTTARMGETSIKTLARRLENETTLVWDGGLVTFQLGAATGQLLNRPGATWEIRGERDLIGGRVVNEGSIVCLGSATGPATTLSSIGALIEQRGEFRIERGGVRLRGGALHTGQLRVQAGSTLSIEENDQRWLPESTLSGDGDVRVQTGTTDFAGIWQLAGPARVGGTLQFSGGPVDIQTLTVTGSIGGPAPVAIHQYLELDNGQLDIGGSVRVLPDAELLMRSGDLRIFRNLVLAGSGVWNTGRVFCQPPVAGSPEGNLLIEPGATMETRGNVNWFNGSVLNEGRFVKAGGNSKAQFSGRFENRNLVNIQTGTLELALGRHYGGFNLEAAAILSLDGFQEFAPASSVVGTGVLIVSQGVTRFGAGSRLECELQSTAGSRLEINPGTRVVLERYPIVVNGQVYFNSGSTVSLSALTVSGAGVWAGDDDLLIRQTLHWPSGEFRGPGFVRLLTDSLSDFGGGDRTLSRRFVNEGRITFAGGRLFNQTTNVFENADSGRFEIRGDGDFFSGTFENRGLLEKTAGTNRSSFAAFFRQLGTLRVQAGQLELRQGGLHSGTSVFARGTRLVLAGTHDFSATSILTGEGGWTVERGQILRFAGQCDLQDIWDMSGNETFMAPALLGLTGRDLVIRGTAKFDTGHTHTVRDLQLIEAADVSGADPFIVTRTATWNSGFLRAGGDLTIASGAAITLSGDRGLLRTLSVEGTAIWNGGRFFNDPNGRLRIATLGMVDLRGDALFLLGSIENQGQFRKSAGTGITTINATLLNAGTMVIETGTVTLQGATTLRGALTLGAGTTWVMENSPLTLEPGMSWAGNGTLRLGLGSQLRLQTPVDFGALRLEFLGNTVVGDFAIRNGPGGLLLIGNSITIPGDVTIGGELRIVGATTTAIIVRQLTLLEAAQLDNAGTLRVGGFLNQSSVPVIGNAPIVIGLPPRTEPLMILELRPLIARSAAPAGGGEADSSSWEIIWNGPAATSYVLETSSNLQEWETHPIQAEPAGPNRHRAILTEQNQPRRFVRLRRL